jgi:hypothetical protein
VFRYLAFAAAKAGAAETQFCRKREVYNMGGEEGGIEMRDPCG